MAASQGEAVICIGTSPAMLIEGLRLARAGAQVTFLERTEAIGGSWRVRDLFGFTGVEVGAHLFESRGATLAALRGVLAEDELVVDEGGFGLIGSRRIPLRAARALLFAGRAPRALVRGDRHAAVQAALDLAGAIAEWPSPLFYPRGGMAALLQRLRDLLANAGARLRFGTAVMLIEATRADVVARCAGGDVRGDRLILSPRAHAPVAGLEQHWADLRTTTIDSLVMLLDERDLRFGGYVELLANRLVRRARRLHVSAFERERPLAVFEVRTMDELPAQVARSALAEAARRGLVRPGTVAQAVHHEAVTYRTLPPGLLRRIEGGTYGRVQSVAPLDAGAGRPPPR